MAVPTRRQHLDIKAAPFFIDNTGLDFKTAPPTRGPSNPNYPRAIELPDGTLPPPGAEGNFIIGPTHNPRRRPSRRRACRAGTTKSFTLSSKESTVYNPGLIRDDVAGCTNSSIMTTVTAPDDKSHMIVTPAIPASGRAPSTSTCRRNMPAAPRRPFIVVGDGGSNAYKDLATTLDNLIRAPRAADARDPDRQWRPGRAG